MPLTDRDIPKSSPERLSRFVASQNGLWIFDDPSRYALPGQLGNSIYYRIPVVFGICRSNAVTPSQVVRIGAPGDYIIIHVTGDMDIMPDKEFKILTSTKKT